MERAAFVFNILNKTIYQTQKENSRFNTQGSLYRDFKLTEFQISILTCFGLPLQKQVLFVTKNHFDYVPFLLFLRFPSFLSFGFTFFSSPDSPSLTVSLCLSSLCLYLGFFDSSSSSESDSELSSLSFSSVRDKSVQHAQWSFFSYLNLARIKI